MAVSFLVGLWSTVVAALFGCRGSTIRDLSDGAPVGLGCVHGMSGGSVVCAVGGLRWGILGCCSGEGGFCHETKKGGGTLGGVGWWVGRGLEGGWSDCKGKILFIYVNYGDGYTCSVGGGVIISVGRVFQELIGERCRGFVFYMGGSA